MKIAYLLDTFPSPSETFIAREIEALRRRGLQITIFAIQAGEGAQTLALPRRNILQKIAGAKWFQKAGAAWWREQNLAAQEFDHIHGGWASHPADIALGAAQVCGLSWSFSGHARDLFVDGANFPEKLRAAKFASVCTRAGQKLLQDAAPQFADKVLYAPHGIEIKNYEFHERTNFSPLQILSVGRLVEKKGFVDLLRAVIFLQKPGRQISATIIGEGPLRPKLEDFLKRYPLPVKLAGAQSHENVIKEMHAANCFVLPCKIARDGDRDGLPNVLLEAAACGLPIVSTRVGGVEDFLDEQTGWLCKPNNYLALGATIEKMLREPDETLRRARTARHRVEAKFDVDVNVQKLARAFLKG